MTDEEKMQKLQEAMDNFLSNVAQRAETAKSVSEAVEEDSTDYEEDSEDYFDEEYTSEEESTTEEGGTENTSTFVDDEEDELLGVKQEQEKTNTSYFSPDDWKKAWMESMHATKAYYDNERLKRKVEEERKSDSQPKQCSDVMFKKNVTTFNGQPFEYKVLQKEADWGEAFTKSFSMDDKITNLDKLNEKLIEDIKLNFGDLTRITDVAVISGMLILNGVQYYPLCNDEEFLNGLPFDCQDYFKSGLIAEIFDFGYLYYMPYLTNIKIDSTDFVIRKFAYDIGIKGEFRFPAVFKAFKNLKFFEMADILVPAPGKLPKDSPSARELDDTIERHSRAAEIYDNYILNNISAFSGWTFNNLKSYACNRGDKGFFRYSGGILARGTLSLAAGVSDLSLKGIGAAVKGGAKLLKKAFSEDI